MSQALYFLGDSQLEENSIDEHVDSSIGEEGIDVVDENGVEGEHENDIEEDRQNEVEEEFKFENITIKENRGFSHQFKFFEKLRMKANQNASHTQLANESIQETMSPGTWSELNLSRLTVTQLIQILLTRYIQASDSKTLPPLHLSKPSNIEKLSAFDQFLKILSKIKINDFWNFTLHSDNWCQECSNSSVAQTPKRNFIHLKGPYSEKLNHAFKCFAGNQNFNL